MRTRSLSRNEHRSRCRRKAEQMLVSQAPGKSGGRVPLQFLRTKQMSQLLLGVMLVSSDTISSDCSLPIVSLSRIHVSRVLHRPEVQQFHRRRIVRPLRLRQCRSLPRVQQTMYSAQRMARRPRFVPTRPPLSADQAELFSGPCLAAEELQVQALRGSSSYS
jgi:hypothetical protein